jgi:hypothetical protein
MRLEMAFRTPMSKSSAYTQKSCNSRNHKIARQRGTQMPLNVELVLKEIAVQAGN